jgi:hypothetical protein
MARVLDGTCFSIFDEEEECWNPVVGLDEEKV